MMHMMCIIYKCIALCVWCNLDNAPAIRRFSAQVACSGLPSQTFEATSHKWPSKLLPMGIAKRHSKVATSTWTCYCSSVLNAAMVENPLPVLLAKINYKLRVGPPNYQN